MKDEEQDGIIIIIVVVVVVIIMIIIIICAYRCWGAWYGTAETMEKTNRKENPKKKKNYSYISLA